MPNRKRQPFALYALFAFIYTLGALYAMSYFFQNSALGDAYFRTRFDAMVDGYAAKPFIYRQLVPIIVRSVDVVTPSRMRDDVNNWMEGVKSASEYRELRRYTPWLQRSFPLKVTHYKRIVASIVIFGFLLGYMTALFMLARALYPGTPAMALFAPLVAIVTFSSFGYQWQYIYDIPCLCLSTACFYLIYTRRHRLYLLAFFLSSLNKETAVFSLFFFAVWNLDKMESRKFLLLWTLQCAIYISVKVAFTIDFMNNSGFFLEQNMPLVLADDLLGNANIHKIVMLMALWFFITHGWAEKPAFLKRALWVFPAVFLAYFLYGFPHEYRVFFDVHGPLVLLATHTLVVSTGIASSPLFSLSNLQWKKHYAAGT